MLCQTLQFFTLCSSLISYFRVCQQNWELKVSKNRKKIHSLSLVSQPHFFSVQTERHFFLSL